MDLSMGEPDADGVGKGGGRRGPKTTTTNFSPHQQRTTRKTYLNYIFI
jgi:hypothetical protein